MCDCITDKAQTHCSDFENGRCDGKVKTDEIMVAKKFEPALDDDVIFENVKTILENPQLSEKNKVLLMAVNLAKTEMIITTFREFGQKHNFNTKFVRHGLLNLHEKGYLEMKHFHKDAYFIKDFRP